MALTVNDILAGYDNPDWLGVGYLRERLYALDGGDETPPQPERVAEADKLVIKVANDRGWSGGELFAWLNSKPGRWYGGAWFSTAYNPKMLAQSIFDNLETVDVQALEAGLI